MFMRSTVLSFLVIITGCSHRFETVEIDGKTLTPKGTARLEGVIYYEPQLVKHIYEYTALADPKGNLLGTAEGGQCKRAVQKEEVVILPDYSRPMAIMYKPSIFAAGTFGVTLKDGMLGGVNVASTPQLPALLEHLPGAVGLFALDPDEPTMCNANPTLSKSVRWQIE